jgi:hypothetical protein
MLKGDGREFFFCFNFRMLKRDGRGVEVNVFFLLSFDVRKEEGKGMIL